MAQRDSNPIDQDIAHYLTTNEANRITKEFHARSQPIVEEDEEEKNEEPILNYGLSEEEVQRITRELEANFHPSTDIANKNAIANKTVKHEMKKDEDEESAFHCELCDETFADQYKLKHHKWSSDHISITLKYIKRNTEMDIPEPSNDMDHVLYLTSNVIKWVYEAAWVNLAELVEFNPIKLQNITFRNVHDVVVTYMATKQDQCYCRCA